MGKATQDLRNEHEAILYVLRILEKMIQHDNMSAEARLSYYDELIYFLKIFADKCHHGKEENYLFKALVNKGIPDEGGPVGAMLKEHIEARDYVMQMSRSFDGKNIDEFHSAAVRYSDLLRQHIEKENNVLFVIADKVISEEEQILLYEQFEKHEEEVIGHGVHEKLHAMIDAWAEAFGLE